MDMLSRIVPWLIVVVFVLACTSPVWVGWLFSYKVLN